MLKNNKRINLLFILTMIFSFILLSYISFRPYVNKHILGEYQMALALADMKNPYATLTHPYPLPNYLVFLPFVKLFRTPLMIKFVSSLFALMIALLIYLFHKDKKQALFRVWLYLSAFHFYIAFARFAINEPVTIFFISLGLILMSKKKFAAGTIFYFFSILIKYFSLISVPYIVLSKKNIFLSKKMIFLGLILFAIFLISIFAFPTLITSIQAHSSQVNRLDNIFFLSAGVLGSKLPNWLPFALFINKLLLMIFFLKYLFDSYKKRIVNPFLLYLIPVCLWLIFPPNNFLWGNYYFWVSIVLLFIANRWATNIYILCLIPEYLLKFANAAPLQTRSLLYLLTYIAGSVLSFVVIKKSLENKSDNKYVDFFDLIKFIAIQIIFFLIVSLTRKYIL